MTSCNRIVLADLHFGAKGDSTIFKDHQAKFFRETFLPYVQEHNIKRIYQLGDFMDRRKYVNYHTLRHAKDVLLNPLRDLGVELYILVGNHDIYYRHSLAINGVSELFYGYSNIHCITEPTTVDDDGIKIDIIPWMCKENEDEINAFIDQSDSQYLFGHLELSGFQMLKGIMSEHGVDAQTFAKYDKVISGHYHTHSQKNNVMYLGTPYEITWSDANDPKYFANLNLESSNIELIRNPHSLFTSLNYDDSEIDYDAVDPTLFADTYIKLNVSNKTDEKMFTRFVNRLYNANPVDLTINDVVLDYDEMPAIENIGDQDPLSILVSSVDSDMSGASEIRSIIKDLHAETLSRGITEG